MNEKRAGECAIQALEQAFSAILWVIIPAMILWASNEMFYRSFGAYRRKAILATGLIGTPVHELSHAVTAIAFSMKVTSIALFKPDPQSQTLGYVGYRYNTASLLHTFGRFWVGIAPLIGGGVVTHWLLRSSAPGAFHYYVSASDLAAVFDGQITPVFEAMQRWLSDALSHGWRVMDIVLVVAAATVSLHATPSRADLRDVLPGLVLTIATIAGFVVLHESVFPGEWKSGVRIALVSQWVGSMIIQMAVIGVVLSLLLTIAGVITRVVVRPKGVGPSSVANDKGASSPGEQSGNSS